jgi:hypothetical protein
MIQSLGEPRHSVRGLLGGRPWWISLLWMFCLYMTFVYLPFDLFLKPMAQDREVWFGVTLAGVWAMATEPLHWIIFALGAWVAHRTYRRAQAEEIQILEGVRKVCKLATVELSLADYAKKTVPKSVDLPFTKEARAYLFYAGVVSAGYDICDVPAGITVDHAARQVRITLPPPRILSVDISRFETINEEQGFLNAISPDDRNKWYADARAALEKGALSQNALDRAQQHALELFEAFVGRHGYTLVMTSPVTVPHGDEGGPR